MDIKGSGSRPSAKGPEEYFTGAVRTDCSFCGSGNLSGVTVTFEPGACTAWHTHSLGQTRLVTAGLGRGFTFHQSFNSLRKRGRHVQAGINSQEESGQVSLPLDLLTVMELQVVGSLGNPHPKDAELLALVVHEKLHPARLVTRKISLDDVTDTLQRMTRFDTVGFEVPEVCLCADVDHRILAPES
jgi:D-arabinose 1-dehydrogenase-like Zn-dependent alcohol dehydrogenase